MTEPDYIAINRAAWTLSNAEYTDGAARRAWESTEIGFGQYHLPESELRVLPDFVGKDVIELGCGTGYFGAWLKRAGAARVVGVDVTPAQLDTARRMEEEFGLGLEFVEANAENVPLPDDSFDLVVSEYGASIWCDPKLWIAEAARLLRAGGELFFLRGSTVRMLCAPDGPGITNVLVRPQRDLYKLEWPETEAEPAGVEFHAPTSEMLAILWANGFELLDFRELYPPDDAVTHPFYSDPPVEWARQWPAEEIWRARLQPR